MNELTKLTKMLFKDYLATHVLAKHDDSYHEVILEDFLKHTENNFGIRLTLKNSDHRNSPVSAYEIVDEQKYMWFLLRYA